MGTKFMALSGGVVMAEHMQIPDVQRSGKNIRILEKKLEILEDFAASAGVYYNFNLTRDIIPGIVHQVFDNHSYNANELMGLPENARFSDYIAYWGKQLPEKEKEKYFAFFDRKNLLKRFAKGESRLCYTYWTTTVTSKKMLAEQHIVLFEDEENGDILGITYIINLTEKFKEAEYKKKLEKSHGELKKTLEVANLNNEIISSISKIYWLIYRMDLLTDMYEEISAGREVHKLTGKSGSITKEFMNVRKRIVAPEYQAVMTAFLDISTLSERLKNTETIAMEYRATNHSWHRGRFIVKKRDASGNVLSVLYLVHVIDEEKRQEMEYEKRLAKTAAEAQRANMAKTDFLRRMSHDIRTPINGIRGILTIAEHQADNPEKQKECRAKIMEASGYLLDLVNHVLDMNKLESGNITLEHVPFDLIELFRESNTIIEMQSEMNAIPFIVNNYGIQHRYLLGSPVHIKQILQNIVGNAMKYNRPGGRVSVSCTEIGSENGRAVFKMICEDTGYGMSREFQKHAFEPFAQELSDARTTYMGTGLGLSIAKQLIEMMGGSITLESEQNVGTTFTMILTFDIDDEVRKKKVEEISDISLDGIRILLVEDNDLNMEIAQFMLENHGMEVTTAQNGKEAVEIFEKSEKEHFDLILMDVMMPVMDGLEAARMIRALNRADAAEIPILALTANAFAEDIRQSKEAGMNEHLSKPLKEKEMLEAIMKYVKR